MAGEVVGSDREDQRGFRDRDDGDEHGRVTGVVEEYLLRRGGVDDRSQARLEIRGHPEAS